MPSKYHLCRSLRGRWNLYGRQQRAGFALNFFLYTTMLVALETRPTPESGAQQQVILTFICIQRTDWSQPAHNNLAWKTLKPHRRQVCEYCQAVYMKRLKNQSVR